MARAGEAGGVSNGPRRRGSSVSSIPRLPCMMGPLPASAATSAATQAENATAAATPQAAAAADLAGARRKGQVLPLVLLPIAEPPRLLLLEVGARAKLAATLAPCSRGSSGSSREMRRQLLQLSTACWLSPLPGCRHLVGCRLPPELPARTRHQPHRPCPASATAPLHHLKSRERSAAVTATPTPLNQPPLTLHDALQALLLVLAPLVPPQQGLGVQALQGRAGEAGGHTPGMGGQQWSGQKQQSKQNKQQQGARERAGKSERGQ